ncbi:hypothetical protein V5P93_001550 [Actinokineospora auranticolor]|uniref:Small secreted domain DUF320 n=1 Tax=Actinokineospora auranticolor TaxID=155976 RepID=A0A2S6GV95_9PSEU|nr:hypothetical protein [Actinokineospora auranticolor]PPK69172.1 hypothetical protein CLV40_104425 [Actinokineospora auranticolor]
MRTNLSRVGAAFGIAAAAFGFSAINATAASAEGVGSTADTPALLPAITVNVINVQEGDVDVASPLLDLVGTEPTP